MINSHENICPSRLSSFTYTSSLLFYVATFLSVKTNEQLYRPTPTQ